MSSCSLESWYCGSFFRNIVDIVHILWYNVLTGQNILQKDCQMVTEAEWTCQAPSVSRYSSWGCRCPGCSEKHRNYRRERRATYVARGKFNHGTKSCYDQGCRQPECLAEATKYLRNWRAQKRKLLLAERE